MGVDHLAQGQLTAHPQVGLVLSQTGCRALDGVHLTVLLRFIQSTDEFPDGILEVFLTNQSHVLFYGFSGERVLAEYEVFSFHEPVHLGHGHV